MFFHNFHTFRKYEILVIIDRVESGLISGLNHYDRVEDAPEFAVAAYCLKHSISRVFNRVSVDDVEKFMKGGGRMSSVYLKEEIAGFAFHQVEDVR